jgi:hypothetical protein
MSHNPCAELLVGESVCENGGHDPTCDDREGQQLQNPPMPILQIPTSQEMRAGRRKEERDRSEDRADDKADNGEDEPHRATLTNLLQFLTAYFFGPSVNLPRPTPMRSDSGGSQARRNSSATIVFICSSVKGFLVCGRSGKLAESWSRVETVINANGIPRQRYGATK